MSTDARTNEILSDEMLERFADRAPIYDEKNTFCTEDFEELRDAGFLKLAIPRKFGGHGMTLAEVCRQQRRLAYSAHATALAVNMHFYWTGTAADVHRSGDDSLDWLLQEAADGEVFAAGHAESGNDIPILLSTTKAEKVEGGYRYTGRKSFGSLGPAWTRLGIHGMDTSDPDAPKVVHAFMLRGAEGSTIQETWDVLGMRATQSNDTVLDGVFIPDDRVVRVVSPGAAGIDLFILGIFAWADLGFANIYYAIAKRAFDMAVASVKGRSSLGLSRSLAYHAEIQHVVAEMVIELESTGPHIEKIAQDWSEGVDYGAEWGSKIVVAKYRAVEGSWRVVDQALELSGGFGIFRKSGFERLFRDVRLGRLHPANSTLTHEMAAKTALGIDLDEQPRWG